MKITSLVELDQFLLEYDYFYATAKNISWHKFDLF